MMYSADSQARQQATAFPQENLASQVRQVLALAAQLGVLDDSDGPRTGLPPVLTVDEAAAVLKVNRKTLYMAIQRRELPGVRRFGRTVRISTEALMTWMFKGRGGDARRGR